jgi:hypothetical protein
MLKFINLHLLFALFLGVDTLLLISAISDLSISYHEAQIFFQKNSSIHHLIHLSTSLFGQNNFALRLPMILLHVMSVILLYMISKPYIRYERDRLWLIIVYMLLPGINSVALLVDDAGLILFFVLLYIYLKQHYKNLAYSLLPFLMLIHSSFMFLYLGLAFFAYENDKRKLFIANTLLFIATLLIYGFDVSGAPQGQFLDTLGIYAVIFSPIVFLYLFYVLYRRTITGPRDELFYIATVTFVLSLLLSFRQRVEISIFAPYLMLALPLAMQNFFHSYRVRLRQFRTKYRVIFFISFALLILNAMSVFLNKEIYYFLKNPKDHFAYRLHVADDLADKLKQNGITCLTCKDNQMQLRLKFYGILKCDKYTLNSDKYDKNGVDVTIFHKDLILYRASVTKAHKKKI